MEHARKMILVPEEKLKQIPETLNENKKEKTKKNENEADYSCDDSVKSVQTPGTIYSRLDKEMCEILNSKQKNEHDKWILYCQVLQRFLHFITDNQSLNIERVNDESTVKKDFAVSDSNILESVPMKYHKKARHLLVRLRQAGVNQISWDDSEKVTINGQQIEDSNIIDLINEAMRERKSHEAIGRRQFARLIRSIGIPREFVGNHELWKEGKKLTPRLVVKRKLHNTAHRFNKSLTKNSHAGKESGKEEEEEEEEDEEGEKAAEASGEENEEFQSPGNINDSSHSRIAETPRPKRPRVWSSLQLLY